MHTDSSLSLPEGTPGVADINYVGDWVLFSDQAFVGAIRRRSLLQSGDVLIESQAICQRILPALPFANVDDV